MEHLIELVTQKAGINPEQAKSAVHAVVDFIKAKLPGPIAGQIDSAIGGGDSGGGASIGGVVKNLGGLMGGS